MSNRSIGFTVIELLAVTALLIAVGVVFWTQKSNIDTSNRDDKRKISINALHYGLEKVYEKENKAYPRDLKPEVLPSVDEDLFKDPNGIIVGESGSDYRYEPSACENTTCRSYTLRSSMQNEADYIKTSPTSDTQSNNK